MNPPPRDDAHANKLTADNEAPGDVVSPGSDEMTQADRKSPPEGHVADDAAGDEGIDDPAVDD